MHTGLGQTVEMCSVTIAFRWFNINRDSGIEIPEAWMPRIKKKNTTTGELYDNGPPREQQNIGTARIEMHQSQRSSVLYKFTHNQSTLSPYED